MKRKDSKNNSSKEEIKKQPDDISETQQNASSEDKPLENLPKRKKKLRKTILGIVIILLVVITAICIRFRNVVRMVVNWDNIMAYVNSQRYSKEDLEKQMADNKAKMEKIAKENPLVDIRGELTEEEKTALANGEITKEQAKKIVKGHTTLKEIRENKKKENESKKDESSNPQNTTPKPDADKGKPTTELNGRVSEIVSELYVIQADFISRLEAIGDSAYADYKATNYDRSKVMSIVDSYTGTVGAMESECDKKVNSLIKELNVELEKAGEDKTLAKDIQKYYYTEKSLKKSYYLDRLNDEDYK